MRARYLALAALCSATACAPATFVVDDGPNDGGDASVTGFHFDAAPTDALVWSNASADAWLPPDGCSADPACLACSDPNDCPVIGSQYWTCVSGASAGHCSTCSPEFNCPSGQQCIYGRCLLQCSGSDTCPPHSTCTGDHVCAACTSNSDCIHNGTGVFCTQTHQCVDCLQDTDCRDRSAPYCDNGQTRSDLAGLCVECRTTADCEAGTCTTFGSCDVHSSGNGPNIDP